MTTLALPRKTLHITAMAVPLRGEGFTTVPSVNGRREGRPGTAARTTTRP